MTGVDSIVSDSGGSGGPSSTIPMRSNAGAAVKRAVVNSARVSAVKNSCCGPGTMRIGPVSVGGGTMARLLVSATGAASIVMVSPAASRPPPSPASARVAALPNQCGALIDPAKASVAQLLPAPSWMTSRAPGLRTPVVQPFPICPSRLALKSPPARAKRTGPSRQRSAMPPCETSIAVPPGVLPSAAWAAAKPSGSTGPDQVTPWRRWPKRPAS